jgi:predicted secreted Zn-dependent protease
MSPAAERARGPLEGERRAIRVAKFNSTWRRESDGRWRVVFDVGCPPCGR